MNRNPPFWLTALIILISLPLILPFLYVVVRAVDVGWVRSIELLWRPRMWELLSNTLLLMVCVTTFSIILGTVCAFLLERYRFWGTIGIMTLSSFPLAYLPVAATLKRLNRSLEEVSLSLGKNRRYTFWHAIFPQLKPAIGSSILLIALHTLVEFGAVSILNYQTFTTAIFQEYEMAFNNNNPHVKRAVFRLPYKDLYFTSPSRGL